jgi:site-specific recombinase XerC
MADAGLRVSEALALRTQDLRRESGRITAITVHAGKGDKDRAVYTTPQLSDKILRWLDARAGLGVGKGLVFCRIKGGAGQPLGVRTVQGLVEHLAREAGIEKRVSPHTLRHTSATRTLRTISGTLAWRRRESIPMCRTPNGRPRRRPSRRLTARGQRPRLTPSPRSREPWLPFQ